MYVYIYISIYVPIRPSIYLPIYLSLNLSFCLYVCLSASLTFCRGLEVQIPVFITSALDGGDCPGSHPFRFTSRE
jgi:hypothetical protein